MSKVYVVSKYVPYEGSWVEVVYSDLMEAFKYPKDTQSTSWKKDEVNRCWTCDMKESWDIYLIQEMEIIIKESEQKQ